MTTTVRRSRTWLSFAGTSLLILGIAATLAASEPAAHSQKAQKRIVTIMPDAADGSDGPCNNPLELQVDAVINPVDGSLSPFAIAAGEVFILKSGTWADSGLAPGSSNVLQISLATATTDNTIVLGPSVLANAAGFAAGTFTVEPGIVIKRGASLCATVSSDGVQRFNFPRLSGFLERVK